MSAQGIVGRFLLPPERQGKEMSFKALQRGTMHSVGRPPLPTPLWRSTLAATRTSRWGKGQASPRGPALRAVSAPGVSYCLWGSDRGCGCEWEGDSHQMSTGPFQGSPQKCAAQLALGAGCVKALWLPQEQCDSAGTGAGERIPAG